MKILVGLGNPGQKYKLTRHNIGFWVVQTLAGELDLKWTERKCRSHLCRGQIAGHKIILAKPRTYMNRSGSACLCLVKEEKVDPGNFLIIYDDLDLEEGQMRLRAGGSSGGHRGMGSIINVLGRQDIPRLRMGIGRPERGEDPRDFVLQTLTGEEQKKQQENVERAVKGLRIMFTRGWEQALNFLNRRLEIE